MPTRLGNVLKNSELYSKVRYNIDAVLVWPRIYSVLPDRLVQSIGAAKSQMDLMLVISILGVAFALLGGVVALVLLPWYAFPACVWGGALVAWLGYQGAVRSALPYAQLIKSAFDLHRGTLLTAIGWQAPTSYGEEKRRWKQIGHLWYRGSPEPTGVQALGYPASKPEKDEEKTKPEPRQSLVDRVWGFFKPKASKPQPEPTPPQAPAQKPEAAGPGTKRSASPPTRGEASKDPEEETPTLVHLGAWLAFISLVIGLIGAGVAAWRQQRAEQPPQQVVPVLVTSLPAYHLITAGDLTPEPWSLGDLPSGVLTQTTSLSGSISLAPLAARQPVTAGQVLQLNDPALISGMTVLAIEGGPALAFGGHLQSGTVVSAWAGERQILDRLLVLDVRRFETNQTSEGLPRYVIIVAVPTGQQEALIAAATEGNLLFSIVP